MDEECILGPFCGDRKVEDYLCYKGMEICQQTMELYKDREKSLGWAGEQTSESGSDSDRNDFIGGRWGTTIREL